MGNLLICGGAIRKTQTDIYKKFIELAGGINSKFIVVPTATSKPQEAFENFKNILFNLGVQYENIEVIKVSEVKGLDDSWVTNGDDYKDYKVLEGATGVWFTGGDQHKIIKAMVREDGSDTKLLEYFRNVLNNGVIGGSSAGAAIMSGIMIGSGTSFGALSDKHFTNIEEYEEKSLQKPLLVLNGLDFFKYGVIDQHFDMRARFGRLIETLMVEGKKELIGFGISENTGLVFNLDTKDISVVGSGGIFIIDVRNGKRGKIGTQSIIEDVLIHYIEGRDMYNLETEKFYFESKEELTNNELNDYKECVSSGILSPYSNFIDFVSKYIIDNKESGLYYSKEKDCRYGKSYLIDELNGVYQGYEIRVYKKKDFTVGYYSDKYSFKNVIVDIIPIELNIKTKK